MTDITRSTVSTSATVQAFICTATLCKKRNTDLYRMSASRQQQNQGCAKDAALELSKAAPDDVLILEDETVKRTASWQVSCLSAASRVTMYRCHASKGRVGKGCLVTTPPCLPSSWHFRCCSCDAAQLLSHRTNQQKTPLLHLQTFACPMQDVAYHSVTAMVGAGVLGLPAAFRQV